MAEKTVLSPQTGHQTEAEQQCSAGETKVSLQSVARGLSYLGTFQRGFHSRDVGGKVQGREEMCLVKNGMVQGESEQINVPDI